MIKSKRYILISLFLPLVSIMALSAFKKFRQSTGIEMTFPIRGYDPRDLLAGHYLQYRVDYGVSNLCTSSGTQDSYICLDNRQWSFSEPTGCSLFIRGLCRYGNFEAGIERYYLPENEAARLERLIREKEASIRVSISGGGSAQIKELLINGQSWR